MVNVKRRRGPNPFAMVVFNGMYPAGRERGEKFLRRATRCNSIGHAPVIVGGVECKAFNAHEVLDPDEWEVIHRRRRIEPEDVAKAGVMFAARKDRVKVLSHEYVWTTNGGKYTMARYALVVRFLLDPDTPQETVLTATVVHMVPMRAFFYWVGQLRRTPLSDFNMGDWNKLARAVGPVTRMMTRMVHIVGFAISRRFSVSAAQEFHIGADHPAVGVLVRGTK